MNVIMCPVLSADAPDADGVLARWLVSDGEHVPVGHPVAEVGVDRRTVRIPSPVAGVIHLLVDQGDAVVQGSPVAHID